MKKRLSILTLLAALLLPWALKAQSHTAVIGNWGGTTTSALGGFYFSAKYSWTQTLYLENEIGGSGYIKNITFDNRSTAAFTADSVKIYLGKTAMTSQPTAAVSSWVPMDSLTLVFSATNWTVPVDTGDLTVTLDNPYYYDGHGTLALVISKANSGSTSSNAKLGYTSTSSMAKYTSGSTESYCRFPTAAGTNNVYKLNVRFGMTVTADDAYCTWVSNFRLASRTTSSITVAWDAESGEDYQVGYTASDGTEDDIVPVAATAGTHTFDGLTEATVYKIWVRHNCSTSASEWQSLLTNTLAQPQEVPLSVDFENASNDGFWNTLNAFNGWYVSTLDSNRALFVSNDGSANAYTVATTAATSWAWMDVNLDEGGYNISFDWRCAGESNYDYLRVFAVPASVEFDNGFSLFGVTSSTNARNVVPEGWILLGSKSADSLYFNLRPGWRHFEGEFTVMSDGIYHLVFLWSNDASGGSQPPAAVDNIELTAASCFAPLSYLLDSASMTASSVTMTINHPTAADFYMLWRPVGRVLYDTVELTSSNYTFDNLSMGTTYEGLVYTLCGGDTSVGSLHFEFTTGCEALTEDHLPYTENFEAYGTGAANPINACWDKNLVGSGTTTNFPYPYSSAAINGSRGLYFYSAKSSSVNYGCWAALPPIDENMEMSDLMVNFGVKRGTSVTNTTTYTYTCRLVVGVAETAGVGPTFVPVDTLDFSTGAASSVHSAEVSFADYTGTGKYVVFYAEVPANVTTYNYNTVYVDDVVLRQIPSCYWPSAVVLDTVTTDEATLSWTPDPRTPNPSSWTVEYGPRGFTLGEGMVETTNDTSIILSDLDVNTEYDVYVSANCGGDVSEPTSFRFQTNSVPATLPYYTGFEAEQDSGWVFLNADQTNRWMIGNHGDATVNGSRALFISDNGSSPNYNITAASIVYAFRLLEVPDTGDYAISFDWRAQGESTLDYLRAFVVPNDVTITPANLNGITATATPTGWLNVGNYNNAVKLNLNGTWTNNETICHVGAGQTGLYKLVFLWRNDLSVGTMPPATVDNVHVWKITCPAPTNVTADSVGAYQIDYSWTAHGTEAGGWEVKLNNGPWIPVSTNSYSATGLTPVTNYTFMVRAICGDEDTSMLSEPLTVRTALDCGPNSINIIDTIGNGTSASYTYTFYGYSTYRSGYNSAIFTAQELNDLGLQVNNRINGLSLHVGSTGGTIRQAKIYMAEDPLEQYGSTAANDTLDRNTMTLVWSGDLVAPANSWVEIMFDSVFTYSGNSNLRITFARDTTPTASVTFYYTTYANNYVNCYGYRSTATTVNLTATRSTYRPNVVFNICTEIPPCMRPTDVEVLNVVDTAMTLTWNGNAANYEVAVSTTSIDHDSTTGFTTYTVADDTITITGLNPNTIYYYYVRSACSATEHSEWTIEGSVHTACSAQSLPYTENFDSYPAGTTAAAGQTMSPCWRKGTNSTTAYPYLYTTNKHSAPNGLYMYGTATSYCYAALPLMADSVKHLMMSFSAYKTSATYGKIWVGVMTNPDDFTTFQRYQRVNVSAVSTWESFEIDFSGYTGPEGCIAFTLHDSAANNAVLDDITVDVIPTCPRPANVTVGNIGQNTATVHWTHSAQNFEIEYGPQGFTLGTGTMVTSSLDSVDLTGLQPSTVYDVYVRAHCSDVDVSYWSFVQSFATVCGLTPLPMIFDMDNYTTGSSTPLPTCWTRTNNATGTTNYYPYIYSSSSNAHTGSNTLYFYVSTSSGYANDEVMVFPQVDTTITPINQVQVDFWAKTSVANKPFVVGVMTNPNVLGSFHAIDTITLSTTVTNYVVPFTGYAGVGSYVALKSVLQGTSGHYTYVDDIVIEAVSPCPRAFDLTAYDGSSTTVSLEWADTIGSTSWMIEYGVLGSDTTNIITANSNPFILTGLTPNTLYRYRVAPICADGQMADWSRTWHNFGTAHNPATVPYNYDFENAAEWANWHTSSSSAVNWYRGNVAQGNATNALYLSADNGATHSWNMNIRTNAVAYRDVDFGPVPGSYQIDFDAYIGGTIGHNYDGISVVVADPATEVVDQDVNITSPWGNVNDVSYGTVRHDTTWGHHTVYLDGMSGVKRIAFYHFNQSTGTNNPYENNPSAIDNVSITLQACERPYDLMVNATTLTSASLTWSGDPAALYEISYRVQGASSSTNVYDTVTGLNYTATNLPSSTDYYWWVRKICTLTATDTVVSDWSPNGVFSTLCGSVSVADTLFEDFESYTPAAYNTMTNATLPNCWESYSEGGVSIYPHVTDSGQYSYCVSGRQALTLTSATSSTSYGPNSYVRLIDIAEPTNTLTVAFWMCTESNSLGDLSVGYLTGANYETDFVAVKTIPASASTVHSGSGIQAAGHGIFDTVSFDSVPAGNFPIAFRWHKESLYYSACIDDIAVWTSFNCSTPEATVSNIQYNKATVAVENPSSTAIGFELAYGTNGDNLTDTLYETSGVFQLTGLNPLKQYYFALRSHCDSTTVSNWATGYFTTSEVPCSVPDNLTVTSVDYEAASFSWAAGGEETAWQVHVFNTTTDIIDTVTTTTYTVEGLQSGITYYVFVSALCGDNHEYLGDASDTVNFTTSECVQVTGVATSEVTASSVKVSWTPTGATKYVVEYGGANYSAGAGIQIVVENSNNVTINGLEADSYYDVYVSQYCTASVTSPWSTKVSFHTAQATEGIDGVEGSQVRLYPNPASTTVSVSGIEGEAMVSVVDVNGREVYKTTANGDIAIDLTGYAKGAYFVRITGERTMAIRKLVVK